MITNIPNEELVRIGSGLQSGKLVLQAGYTLRIAGEDGAPLEALVEGPGFLNEVEGAKESPPKKEPTTKKEPEKPAAGAPWKKRAI